MTRGSLEEVSAETLTRRVRLSVAAQVIGQLATSLLGLFIVKVATGSLGLSGYGIYSTATTFVFAFALVTDLGLNTVTAREISRAPSKAQQILSDNLGMRLSMSAIAIPAICGISFVLYGGGRSDLRVAVLIAACTLPFDSTRSIIAAYFTAHVLNAGTAVVNAAQQASLLGFVALAAAVRLGPTWFVTAYLGAYVFAAILMWTRIRRVIRLRPHFKVKRWRPIIAASVSVGLLQIVSVLYLRIDGILISVIRSPSAAGVYAVANLLISAVYALASYVMTALVPSLANEEPLAVAKIVQRVSKVIATLGCGVAAVGLVTAKDLVRIVSSAQFAAAAVPFQILVVANIFTGLITVVSYACVFTNRHRPIVMITIGSLVLNIILNMVLIPLWSLRGSALATLICEVLMIALAVRAFRREVGHSLPMSGDVSRSVISGAVATAGGCYASKWLSRGDMPLVLHAGLTGIVAMTLFVLAAFVICDLPWSLRPTLRARSVKKLATAKRGQHRTN